MISKFEQQRRQIVRELAVFYAGASQRVAHGHVREQRGRRQHQRAQRQQRLEQSGLVQQRVGTFRERPRAIARRRPLAAATRQREHDETQIRITQPATHIRQDHVVTSR